MSRTYLCPCCGKCNITTDFHVCNYCAWNDWLEPRTADDDNGFNPMPLPEARKVVAKGRNVFGGSLPWDNIN